MSRPEAKESRRGTSFALPYDATYRATTPGVLSFAWTAAKHGNKVGGVCGGLGIEEEYYCNSFCDDAYGSPFVVIHVSLLSYNRSSTAL